MSLFYFDVASLSIRPSLSSIERFMGYITKVGMLRIDMALIVSLALNGSRSE